MSEPDHGSAESGEMVRISVVVCAHNESALLEKCLESLLDQDYPMERFEIVVVDDGSKDGTWDIAERVLVTRARESMPHCELLRIPHSGLCNARNTGIRFSRAEIIAFTDGDAIVAPSWLATLERAFDDEPGVGAVGGRIRILNTWSRVARFLHHSTYDYPDTHDIIGANMAYRRRVLAEVGYFNSCFWSRGDETDLLRRVSKRYDTIKRHDLEVQHERPERFGSWIRERRANGKFWAWCETFAERDGSIPTSTTSNARIKRIVTLLPALLVPLAFVSPWLLVGAAPGVLAIVRRNFGGRTGHLVRGLVGEWGLAGALLVPVAIGLNVIGDAWSDWGYVEGLGCVPEPDETSTELPTIEPERSVTREATRVRDAATT